MKPAKVLILMLLFLFSLSRYLHADTISLKNGRSIEGIIKSEANDEIELEIGWGTVKFSSKDIARITKSTPEEASAIMQGWQERKAQQEKESLAQAESQVQAERSQPRAVGFQEEKSHIRVNVILEHKVAANLLLDTGASLVVLSHEIGKKLGVFEEAKGPVVTLVSANGGKSSARYIMIKSISIEGVEARDVDAAVLMEDTAVSSGIGDGVLGMSFLKQFNFKFDPKNKKLILERAE